MKRLLLAGAGHAHLNVIRNLASQPWPGVEVTLICPYPRQIYSGMIPGWIAGHYTLDQCAAPLAGLLEKAGIHWIQDSICGMDAANASVNCQSGAKISYDVISIDTGARVESNALSNSGAPLLPIRPLEQFAIGWNTIETALIASGSARLAIIGGGAAGVELALAVDHALRQNLPAEQVAVALISSGALLGGHAPGVVKRVDKLLKSRGITQHSGRASGHDEGLILDSGELIACDCIIAATGVAPPNWLAESGLALCERGFIAVGDGQQSTSHQNVFAAGDVSSRIDFPHAKSGVYAVRAGPILTMNLQNALNGQPPAPYQPQKRSLYLLATGPREAILSWGSFSAGGGWAWSLKDWIDRRFMRQYQTN
jgi:pyridine nucleotide-disulfide oxidoreductase family protein